MATRGLPHSTVGPARRDASYLFSPFFAASRSFCLFLASFRVLPPPPPPLPWSRSFFRRFHTRNARSFRPAISRVHMPLNMPCDSRSSGRLFVSMVAIYRLQTRTPGEETTARSGNRGPALENNEI